MGTAARKAGLGCPLNVVARSVLRGRSDQHQCEEGTRERRSGEWVESLLKCHAMLCGPIISQLFIHSVHSKGIELRSYSLCCISSNIDTDTVVLVALHKVLFQRRVFVKVIHGCNDTILARRPLEERDQSIYKAAIAEHARNKTNKEE